LISRLWTLSKAAMRIVIKRIESTRMSPADEE
jgi:hypothetical protein